MRQTRATDVAPGLRPTILKDNAVRALGLEKA